MFPKFLTVLFYYHDQYLCLVSILIPKLKAHGFPERIISIYDDFLSDRKAFAEVGESITEPWCGGQAA